MVVELEAQTLPQGASVLLETISKILQDIGTQVKNAKGEVSSVAADAAALQTLRKVIDLLNNLVNTMRDLLAKLGGVASDQSRKLGDISRQVANKVHLELRALPPALGHQVTQMTWRPQLKEEDRLRLLTLRCLMKYLRLQNKAS